MVQQRFALLWGRGAYDVYNAKMQRKWYRTHVRKTLREEAVVELWWRRFWTYGESPPFLATRGLNGGEGEGEGAEGPAVCLAFFFVI